ncbi:MAG: KDO2-lipid IV(A) lauroyltransferase [Verrucomicrobia bacterium]|nr:MAG: KDO2-lipid IV(A) lauroyltransferase [Verrucomicrobiota bacterium]
MAAFVLVLVVGLILGGRLLLLRRQGDYKNAAFYKVLYTPVGFQLAIFGRRLFGRWISERFCEVSGLAYALTHASTLAAIQRNMALLDPSKATRSHAIRNCITQGYNFLEFAELWLKKKGEIQGMIGEQSGLEEFAKAQALGKGCILVTGHLGFFELGGPLLAELGFPMVTLTLPEPSEALTQWRSEFRLRWGVRTLVVGGDAFSAVEITRELRSGTFVALLADRPFNEHSVPVPLPHGEILFSTAPVMVSLLSGAPIIPVGLTLQPDGKHRVEARPMITPKWLPEGREASLLHFTQKLAQELTPMFVRAPEQWHHFSDIAVPRP